MKRSFFPTSDYPTVSPLFSENSSEMQVSFGFPRARVSVARGRNKSWFTTMRASPQITSGTLKSDLRAVNAAQEIAETRMRDVLLHARNEYSASVRFTCIRTDTWVQASDGNRSLRFGFGTRLPIAGCHARTKFNVAVLMLRVAFHWCVRIVSQIISHAIHASSR